MQVGVKVHKSEGEVYISEGVRCTRVRVRCVRTDTHDD